ncbi:MAG: hypothetical protein KIT24_03150 [Phycisphaeraceae bacterium]|nr:hypothetical protein [Phycisphaeraceae bacterium]
MRIARCLAIVLSAGLCTGAWSEPERFDDHKVVRVTPTNVRELQAALAIADGLWSERAGIGPFEIHVSPDKLADLHDAGVAFIVLIDDIQALIDAERAANDAARMQRDSSFFDAYRTYDEIRLYTEQLAAEFPDLCTFEVIGQSLQGRDIFAVTITAPGDASARPVVALNGCQHAREWASLSTVMYIIDTALRDYDAGDPRAVHLLGKMAFRIVPVVNPDGYVFTWDTTRLWRKNRRVNGNGTFGVDLNRNWDVVWGGPGASSNPGSDTYRGTGPFSEPETQVLSADILADPRIVAHVDVHTYGQLILHPYGYTTDDPPEPDNTFFRTFSRELADVIRDVHGVSYTPQPSIDLYITSGTLGDWTYANDIKGWTFELRPATQAGGGFILPPDQIRPLGQEVYQAIMHMADRFGSDLVVRVTLPGDVLEADVVNPVEVEIINAASTLVPGSAQVIYRTNLAMADVARPLVDLGDGRFRADLPGLACGRAITWRIEADAASGERVRWPLTGAIEAGYRETLVLFDDDMETDQGWIVGAPGDTATSGIWERAQPQATPAQPGQNHTPGGLLCYVTGAAAGSQIGSNDVDNGATTLTSPPIDARVPADWLIGESLLTYHRWYSNDRGNAPNQDSMPVLMSTDGDTWHMVELVTENANAWVRRDVRIADVLEPGAATQLRFVARDDDPGSIVEAAVDDVIIRVVGCRFSPADLTRDGQVDAEDFFEFLDRFVASDLSADLNADGVLDAGDFFLYLDLFVAG